VAECPKQAASGVDDLAPAEAVVVQVEFYKVQHAFENTKE